MQLSKGKQKALQNNKKQCESHLSSFLLVKSFQALQPCEIAWNGYKRIDHS